MNPEPLPPHLREWEERLARRPGPEPPAELRTRFLSAVNEARPLARRTGRSWPIVWRVAAAVILVLNLGLSAANGIRFRQLASPRTTGSNRMMAVADDRWSVLAASAVATLSPAPDTGALGRDFFSDKGEGQWDMR